MQEKLTFEELLYVQNEVKNKGKKTWAAYLLLFTLGHFGAHYAYLEKIKFFIFRILLTLATIISFVPLGEVLSSFEKNGLTKELELYGSSLLTLTAILFIGGFVWFIYDISKIPQIIKFFNSNVEKEASSNVYVSRNVQELILRNEVSKDLVLRTSEAVELKVEERINSLEREVEEKQAKIEKMNFKNEDSLQLIRTKTEELESLLASLLENAERKNFGRKQKHNRNQRRR